MTISKPKWFIVWDQVLHDDEDDQGRFIGQTFAQRFKAFRFRVNAERRIRQVLDQMLSAEVFDYERDQNIRIVHGLTIDGRIHELKAI